MHKHYNTISCQFSQLIQNPIVKTTKATYLGDVVWLSKRKGTSQCTRSMMASLSSTRMRSLRMDRSCRSTGKNQKKKSMEKGFAEMQSPFLIQFVMDQFAIARLSLILWGYTSIVGQLEKTSTALPSLGNGR